MYTQSEALVHNPRGISKGIVSFHCKQPENWTKYIINKWFQTLENRQHRTMIWNRKEAKRGESYDCLGFLPGGVYQTSVQGGRTQAEHRGLTELMG